MRISLSVNLLCRVLDPAMLSLRMRISQFAEMEPESDVLDICCGTGAQVFDYAKTGIVAAGIDMDRHLIWLAERKRMKVGLKNASFQWASALDLPFKDSSFGYASITLALHEKRVEDRIAIITEMKRVVKENGHLIFVDYGVPLPQSPYAYLSRMLEYTAGGDHYRCFRNYVKHGGLKYLLGNSDLSLEKEEQLGPLLAVKVLNRK